MTVVQDPMDFKNHKRNAWTYDPGTRRVRKAPAIGYDNPDGPGGMQTIDDHKGFNGAFDRFDYTMLGKKKSTCRITITNSTIRKTAPWMTA